MKAKKVGVYTDKNVAQLPAMKVAIDSLTKAGVNFEVYDDVRVEPTDTRYNGIQTLLHYYRVEKNGLQNIAKQNPGRAGQNR